MTEEKIPEFPRGLPSNEVEAELMLDQARKHLAARFEIFKKAVDEAKKKKDAILAADEANLDQAKQQLKDAEAEKLAAQQKLEETKQVVIEEMQQRKEKVKQEVESLQQRVVQARVDLEMFKQHLQEYEQQVEEKLNKADQRLEVLVAIKKMYMKYTQMDLEVDENKLITITMLIPDTQSRKVKEFSFKLQELTRKEKYQLIDPHPEILKVLDNMEMVTNPGKCLYDIRCHLINHPELMTERKSKKSQPKN